MSIKEKFEKMRGMGHNIPPGLDEILHDMDKRISALEPKQAQKEPAVASTGLGANPQTISATNQPVYNPLDGTTLKS